MPLPAITVSAAKKESDSLLLKAAMFLNRTNSAAMGAVSEGIGGGDPLGAIGKSLTGKAVYGGQDVMAQLFGGDPASKVNRRVGLAMDILNPLDPLNYVGVGALTKTGKAAKLIGGLGDASGLAKPVVETIVKDGTKITTRDFKTALGAQTKAGQRGLLTFAGARVPLPGDARIMDALGATGKALAATPPGRGINKLFGGRKGYIAETLRPELKAAGITPEMVEQFTKLGERADYVAHTFTTPSNMALDALKHNLRSSEIDGWNAMMDNLEKGEDFVSESAKFIGAGRGANRRRKAVEAAQDFMNNRAEWAKQLGDEGVGGMAENALGYMPRILKPDPGVSSDRIAAFYGRRDAKTGKIITLEGASDNHFNRALTLDSEQPIAVNTLTDAGKLDYQAKITADPEHFNKLRKDSPAAYRDWIKQNRLPREELARMVEDVGIGTIEGKPWAMMKAMHDEIAQKLRVTTLVESMEKAGLAKKWDDIPEAERALYVKVDRGKWTNSPLAIPSIYDSAMKRFQEVYMPGPDKPVWMTFLNELLPRPLQNLGIIPWWKAVSIYGGGPTAYWTRNLASGVLKNWHEGLGPGPRSAALYKEAAELAAQSFKGRPEQLAETLDGYWLTKQGIPVSRKRLGEEYNRRMFHGGGSREGAQSELLPDIDSPSANLRERIVGPLHRINFRNEMMLRLPLAMKTFEDTFDAAAKHGIPLPKRVESLSLEPEVIGDLVDRAFTNAKEAVIRAHFDYDDLTPFERTLRAHYIPFYTWMRKNIPHETVNMVTQPGKYMPYARAYYNAFEQQEITPEDLPEWAHRSFATPISPEDGDRARWLDWTGYLPFLDVAELADAVAGPPQTGRTRAAEVLRYLAIRSNPFITQTAEQGLQKSFFTSRSLDVDTPQDIAGVTVGAPLRHALGLVRPIVEADRLNPGGIFGKTPRPHRNEPEQPQRILRALTGVKVRATDRDEASMTTRERLRQIESLRRDEKRELRDGNRDGALFIKERRERLEKGLR